MYSRQESSHIKKEFWTKFGLYMRPLPNADGETVNWLNYKTGAKHIYFRMDSDVRKARIAIELRHPDPVMQKFYFDKLRSLEKLLVEATGEPWNWELHATDEDGKTVSRVGLELKDINVFEKEDWPRIISFLKPRILALDNFWSMVKEEFV